MRVSLISFTVSVVLSLSASFALFAGVPVIPAVRQAEIKEEAFNKKNLGRIKYVKAKDLPAEAYELQIKKNRIVVKSSDDAGRFYAQQTLKQLAEADVMYRGVIKDAPRYAWRGFMLDEARHFHGKEQVKESLTSWHGTS